MQDFTITNTTTNYSKDLYYYCGYPTMLFQADPPGYVWDYPFKHGYPGVSIPKEILYWNASNSSLST